MIRLDESSIQQGTDSQIELWSRRVMRVILMDIAHFRQAIPAEREMPHSIIIPIAFFKEMSPLLARQTRKMFRLALSIMRLHNAAESICFCVKLVRVAVFVRFDVQEILRRDSHFID